MPTVVITVRRRERVAPSLSQHVGQVSLEFLRPEPAARAPAEVFDAKWRNLGAGQAVDRLARFLGLRLIYDASLLRGTVSVEAQGRLTHDEARALFDAVLLMKGLAAVSAPGGATKLVGLASAPGRWVEALDAEQGGEALVTLVKLEEVAAEVAAQAIEPLVGDLGWVQAHPPTNAVLMAGVAPRLSRLADVLHELDDAGITRVVVIPLRNAAAEATAELVLETFDGERGFGAWADARTGRIIVRARPDTLPRVREFVSRLDRPATGEGRIQVILIEHADPEEMADLLRSLSAADGTSPPGSARSVRGANLLAGRALSVSVHVPTHSLVVQAEPETIRLVRELIAEIDRPPPAVIVEVGVTEVTISDGMALSFDALVPLLEPEDATDWVAAGVFSPSGAVFSDPDGTFVGRLSRSPILVTVFNPITGTDVVIEVPRETAVVTAEASTIESRVLMQPKLLLLSGEEHEIFSGENVPVVQGSTEPSGNALRITQDVERRDVGITLRVTPSVPEEGPIVLDLVVEASSVSGSLGGNPTFEDRHLEAMVRLDAGSSAVIGTVQQPRTVLLRTGVPWLMDLPWLGWLFRSDEEGAVVDHLIFTVTAERQHHGVLDLTRRLERALVEEPPAVAAEGS